jgi:hypothetical protein
LMIYREGDRWIGTQDPYELIKVYKTKYNYKGKLGVNDFWIINTKKSTKAKWGNIASNPLDVITPIEPFHKWTTAHRNNKKRVVQRGIFLTPIAVSHGDDAPADRSEKVPGSSHALPREEEEECESSIDVSKAEKINDKGDEDKEGDAFSQEQVSRQEQIAPSGKQVAPSGKPDSSSSQDGGKEEEEEEEDDEEEIFVEPSQVETYRDPESATYLEGVDHLLKSIRSRAISTRQVSRGDCPSCCATRINIDTDLHAISPGLEIPMCANCYQLATKHTHKCNTCKLDVIPCSNWASSGGYHQSLWQYFGDDRLKSLSKTCTVCQEVVHAKCGNYINTSSDAFVCGSCRSSIDNRDYTLDRCLEITSRILRTQWSSAAEESCPQSCFLCQKADPHLPKSPFFDIGSGIEVKMCRTCFAKVDRNMTRNGSGTRPICNDGAACSLCLKWCFDASVFHRNLPDYLQRLFDLKKWKYSYECSDCRNSYHLSCLARQAAILPDEVTTSKRSITLDKKNKCPACKVGYASSTDDEKKYCICCDNPTPNRVTVRLPGLSPFEEVRCCTESLHPRRLCASCSKRNEDEYRGCETCELIWHTKCEKDKAVNGPGKVCIKYEGKVICFYCESTKDRIYKKDVLTNAHNNNRIMTIDEVRKSIKKDVEKSKEESTLKRTLVTLSEEIEDIRESLSKQKDLTREAQVQNQKRTNEVASYIVELGSILNGGATTDSRNEISEELEKKYHLKNVADLKRKTVELEKQFDESEIKRRRLEQELGEKEEIIRTLNATLANPEHVKEMVKRNDELEKGLSLGFTNNHQVFTTLYDLKGVVDRAVDEMVRLVVIPDMVTANLLPDGKGTGRYQGPKYKPQYDAIMREFQEKLNSPGEEENIQIHQAVNNNNNNNNNTESASQEFMRLLMNQSLPDSAMLHDPDGPAGQEYMATQDIV